MRLRADPHRSQITDRYHVSLSLYALSSDRQHSHALTSVIASRVALPGGRHQRETQAARWWKAARDSAAGIRPRVWPRRAEPARKCGEVLTTAEVLTAEVLTRTEVLPAEVRTLPFTGKWQYVHVHAQSAE